MLAERGLLASLFLKIMHLVPLLGNGNLLSWPSCERRPGKNRNEQSPTLMLENSTREWQDTNDLDEGNDTDDDDDDDDGYHNEDDSI